MGAMTCFLGCAANGYTAHMSSGDEQARAARQLLAGVWHGVLSTHSLEHPGYPFGSVVPYALDQAGLPLLLMSPLSQHTKNIDADPRCGLTVVEPGEGDVQQRGRLSAVGDMQRIDATTDAGRYFAYFPHSRMYFEQLGFRFYRFAPSRFHWNGGFATARWFGVDRIVRANPLDPEAQARIFAHMNRDHADTLRHYLAERLTVEADAAVKMLAMDAEGVDLRLGERLYRIALPRTVGSAEDAREVLIEMSGPRDS